jgi:hypothetical protein
LEGLMTVTERERAELGELGTAATPERSRGERLWGQPGLRPISQPEQPNSPQVFDGHAIASADGERFELGPGDVFAVPSPARVRAGSSR